MDHPVNLLDDGRSTGGAQEEGEDAVAKLDSELQSGKRLVEEAVEAEQNLSSHVWICTSTHASSKVRLRIFRVADFSQHSLG